MGLEYILITPAHNEEAFIEKTIKSVISQTVLPKKWVIVSDGCTDRTDDIVIDYARLREWIELIKIPAHGQRNFASKVRAFNAGYQRVKDENYGLIGNLDADISFGKDYFEYLVEKFEKFPNLGVAGTDYIEGKFHSFRDSYINVQHVNGQCQLFRRKCFDDIGGYTPIKQGGIDWVAVTTARMKGWETYSFSGRTYYHHRSMGTGKNNSVLLSRFHYGKKDYFLGGHPLWELFRVVFQMTKEPYLIGGFFLMMGYIWGWIRHMEKPISAELIEFHRKEQIKRLRELLSYKLRLNRQKPPN